MSLLDEVLRKLEALPPETIAELERARRKDGKLFVPNSGGQTLAWFSKADELFFGGEPGGGKSFLLLGLALTEHTDSIIFRREYPQIKGLEKDAAKILGSRDGYNSQEKMWRIPGTKRTMEFGSVPHEWDVERYQGRAHSLKGFDEICHFSKSQYKYLTLWLRTAIQGERCRIVCTGNPPQSPEGFWVVDYWAPWLDDTYPDPAAPGELRWAVPLDDDSDKELFFRTPEQAIAHMETLSNPPRDENGKIRPPRSRSFIPGKLGENPDLVRTGYQSVLAYASRETRALAAGKFNAAVPDHEWQVIPTQWIIEAQKRWTPKPPDGAPMTAIGVDVAQGGMDETVLSCRHDWWYAPIISAPGSKTPMPSDVAAMVVKHRRDQSAIIVDCGGGYGGGVVERLAENRIEAVAFKGSGAGQGRTKDRKHAFFNRRASAIWKFREALDPDQPGGSPIALPDSPEIRADLASYRYEIGPRGIKIEEKEETKKRIGRSPDKGDAIWMAWSEGNSAVRRGKGGVHSSWFTERPKFATVSASAQRRRRT